MSRQPPPTPTPDDIVCRVMAARHMSWAELESPLGTRPERQHRSVVRREMAVALRAAGYDFQRCAAAMRLSAECVRGYTRPVDRQRGRVRGMPVRLPVLPAFDGPSLVFGDGPRRDCAREDDRAECSRNTLILWNKVRKKGDSEPEAWHCPEGCRWYEAPKRGARMVDAMTGKGWAW